MNFSITKAIASFAPTLATMLGGPLAGTAVTALEGALGLASGAGQDGITTVLQTGMTPDKIADVRAADQKHAEIISQQGIDLATLNANHEAAMAATDAGDRDSARKREMAIKDPTVARLAYVSIGGFLGVSVAQLLCLMVWPEQAAKIPPSAWLLVGNISGYLASEAKSASSYYFGTSSGSQEKSAALADIAKQA